jgi:hypothetical protein
LDRNRATIRRATGARRIVLTLGVGVPDGS